LRDVLYNIAAKYGVREFKTGLGSVQLRIEPQPSFQLKQGSVKAGIVADA
jgi:hypothetical protein